MQFQILGPLEVRNDDKEVALGGPQPRMVLAALLSNPNRAVSADLLVQEVWGEDASSSKLTGLQTCVSRLRKELGEGRIEKTAAGYRLRVEPGELDAEHFARAAEDGKQAMTAGAPERAARLLREALEMWDGEPFGGVVGPIAQAEADRMVENGRAARDARVAAELDAGCHETMVGELRGAVDLHPTDEAVAIPLMLALYRCRRQEDALEVFVLVREALAELGLTPSPALQTMQKRILDQDEALEFSEPVAAPGTAIPLPPVLAALPNDRVPVVGREAEIAQVRRIVGEVDGGARRVVLIDGAAGVGKTRLATDIALEAQGAGFAVGWGASAQGVSAPYGVWHDAISHLARHMPHQRVAEHLTEYGNTISHLLPWFDRWSPPSFEPQSSTAAAMLSSPSEEPHLLFAAVAGLLRTLCADQPVALVLDDVHWANAQSLRLLRYVAGDTPDLRLLVIAACRDRETPESYPVRALHADLKRLPDAGPPAGFEPGGAVLSLELHPLSRGEVRAFVTAVARHDTGPGGRELADALFDETAGTPFLVLEVLRHLRSREAVEEDPDGRWRLLRPISEDDLPHDVVTHCVEELGPDAHAILSAAAVIGGSFDARLLARLVELSEERVAKALAAACRAHVLGELKTPPKHYTFEHACFQHSLYAQIPADQSSLRHLAVALALEETGRGDPLERAHHWVTADHPEYADQAVHYARRAGERALEQLAADDAVRWFTAASEKVTGDEAQRCDILTRLGVAERQLGRDYGATLSEASDIAAGLGDDRGGDSRRLARAVIANSAGPFGAPGHADEKRVEWLERALGKLPKDDPELPLVRAVLGKELYFGGDPKAGTKNCRQALAEARARYGRIARGVAAPQDSSPQEPTKVPTRAKRELAGVLAYAIAITPATPPEEHAALGAELAELAEELDDRELRFGLASTRFMRAMHVGDPGELDEGLRRMEEVARSGAPILRWTAFWSASARRLVEGDLTGAGEMADEAAALGRSRHVENEDIVAFGQRMGIAAEAGTLLDLTDEAERLAREHPYLPLLQLARPFIKAETEQYDEAAELFGEAVKGGYVFHYPQTRAACMARCAEIALRLGESHRYAELYGRLQPYEDQFATPSGITSRGSIRLSLGRLAAARGDDREAERHFKEADRAHRVLRAPLMQARTDLARGEALLERKPEPAAELLLRARERAALFGGGATVKEADKLLERARGQQCARPSSALLS